MLYHYNRKKEPKYSLVKNREFIRKACATRFHCGIRCCGICLYCGR